MVGEDPLFVSVGWPCVLSSECERALKKIGKLESELENFEAVERGIERDCLDELVNLGYVRAVYLSEDSLRMGLGEDRYERTHLGRSYFRDRRRKWVWDNSGSLLALVGTIVGAIVGFIFGRAS